MSLYVALKLLLECTLVGVVSNERHLPVVFVAMLTVWPVQCAQSRTGKVAGLEGFMKEVMKSEDEEMRVEMERGGVLKG